MCSSDLFPSHDNLPIYYRNKIYTEDEREKLWIQKLNKEIRYVLGEKIDVSKKEGQNKYMRKLKAAQNLNTLLGYSNNEFEQKRQENYNRHCKQLTNLTKQSLVINKGKK